MNERAQVLNSVPSIPSGGLPKPWAENVMNKDTQNISDNQGTPAIGPPSLLITSSLPSKHRLWMANLDPSRAPDMRHATCADVGNEVSTKESWDTERGSQNLSSIKRMVLPVYKNVLLKECVGQLVQISFEKGELSDRNKQDVRTASVNSFKEAKS